FQALAPLFWRVSCCLLVELYARHLLVALRPVHNQRPQPAVGNEARKGREPRVSLWVPPPARLHEPQIALAPAVLKRQVITCCCVPRHLVKHLLDRWPYFVGVDFGPPYWVAPRYVFQFLFHHREYR